MTDINIAVKEAVAIASDNKHGYSQKNRTGKPDYDCSSLVIHCLDIAGFPMSKNGATYTGNMATALRKCGFVNVRNRVNVNTGAGLLAGDVLLNESYHTAIMVSSTKAVAAHDNYDGKTGDSSGKEINVYKYKNYSRGWQYVFRYYSNKENTYVNNESIYKAAADVISGKYGNGQERIDRLTAAGWNYTLVQTVVNQILAFHTVAMDVISGRYSNGSTRRQLLRSKGYDPDIVQKIVNAILTKDVPKNLI